MKVYLASLGCKLNESELEAWARQFANNGHEMVTDPLLADICVLNSCTVTHVARPQIAPTGAPLGALESERTTRAGGLLCEHLARGGEEPAKCGARRAEYRQGPFS